MQPTHRYRCDQCEAETIGPEHPGYVPYCPACGIPLTKTPLPLKPEQESAA